MWVRTLCVWFPDWPLERPDAPSDRPFLVVEAGPNARVVAATSTVIEAGVRPGMPRREAEGLSPDASVLVRDLGEEARRFEDVVLLLEELIPRVELLEPGTAFIPVKGALAYYGGERQVVDQVAGKLAAAGHDARLGLADGPFAATWAARTAHPGQPILVDDTRRFLASLDVDALTRDRMGHEDIVSVFRWLGVTTLGALADLPRDALATRFGSEGLAVHRLAQGEDRMLQPRPIPPELAVEATYEEPMELLDQLAFAARALSAKLANGLRRNGMSPFRVVVEIEAADGTVRERVWRSTSPFTESALADRVWWQARAWIDSGQVSGGVVRIKLDPSDLSGAGRQLGMFEDVASQVEAERALARAQALVGPESVLQAQPQGGRMPQDRVAWRRWGEAAASVEHDSEAPWPGATPSPTPALVPPDPTPFPIEWDSAIPVRVRLGSRWEPVIGWSGPWRMTGRWWRGEHAVDRYQIVTSAGAFLCVVTSEGSFLAGVYD
jgi:protein ImuB